MDNNNDRIAAVDIEAKNVYVWWPEGNKKAQTHHKSDLFLFGGQFVLSPYIIYRLHNLYSLRIFFVIIIWEYMCDVMDYGSGVGDHPKQLPAQPSRIDRLEQDWDMQTTINMNNTGSVIDRITRIVCGGWMKQQRQLQTNNNNKQTNKTARTNNNHANIK